MRVRLLMGVVVLVAAQVLSGGAAGALPQAPIVTPAPAALNAVSCPSVFFCMAVGGQGAARSRSLAERWNGHSWIVVAMPPTGAADTYLTGVSCSSADACTAVGYTQPGQGLAYPASMLVERWNGSTWEFQSLPRPSGSGLTAYLLGVSCPSATRCVAVGFYTVGGTGTGTMAAVWNGKMWSRQSFVYPGAELLGVSCAEVASCVGVGQYGFQTASDHWNGTTWSPQMPPNPTTPIPGDGLNAVSCSRLPFSGCQTVGVYAVGDAGQRTFGLGWNAKTLDWTMEYTPSPGDSADLLGVSCATTSACITVGGHPSDVGELPLIGQWDGTSWATQHSPLLRGTLDGISCTTANACTAVGLTIRSAGGLPLIERWNGTTWSLQRAA